MTEGAVSALTMPTPALNEPPSKSTSPSHIGPALSPTSSHSSSDEGSQTSNGLQRPKLGSRKSSGTMIVSRDSPRTQHEAQEEEYDAEDVRSMSPRRSSETIEKLGEDARKALIEYVRH